MFLVIMMAACVLVQCDDLVAYRQHYPDEDVHVQQNDTIGDGDLAMRSEIKAEDEDEIPFVQYLLGPGLDRRGTYVVKESVEKAPVHDHPCNLTKTAVRISFPEMKNEVFVNLLGYKGSDLIYLNRCKGVCMNNDERKLKCKAIGYQEKRVKMMVKAYRTEEHARESFKDLILDDHTQCGCECGEESEAECAGIFNRVTCACECPLRKFGKVRDECLSRSDHFWNSGLCFCESRRTRGLPDHYNRDTGPGGCGDMRPGSLVPGGPADMLVWVALGSSFTLVLVLAWLTRYYRAKLIKIRGTSTHSIEKITFDDGAILENDDGQNNRYSNSSTSGEFENVFPYREQIEHFLSATRDLRKSRANSLENILDPRKHHSSETEEVKYNHHNPQGSQVLCQQHFAHQEIQAKEDSCYNDSINV